MVKYRLSNSISKLFYNIGLNNVVSYLSEDKFLSEQYKINKPLFFIPPFTPDGFVYCGLGAFEIQDLNNIEILKQYEQQNKLLPKVIIYQDNIFFIAQNIKKAKEIEDVFKSNIMILLHNKNVNNIYLTKLEIDYLNNWDAEKYRQNL